MKLVSNFQQNQFNFFKFISHGLTHWYIALSSPSNKHLFGTKKLTVTPRGKFLKMPQGNKNVIELCKPIFAFNLKRRKIRCPLYVPNTLGYTLGNRKFSKPYWITKNVELKQNETKYVARITHFLKNCRMFLNPAVCDFCSRFIIISVRRIFSFCCKMGKSIDLAFCKDKISSFYLNFKTFDNIFDWHSSLN